MNDVKASDVIQMLNLFNREKLDISGVVEIISSSEKEIVVKLEDSYLQILGDELIILKLIPESKMLGVNGKVRGISYLEKVTKKSFLKKVFK